MEKEEVKVNESIAELFYDQCMGSYSGHMSLIPNNPTLKSICYASGVRDKKTFLKFLSQVVEKMPDNIF